MDLEQVDLEGLARLYERAGLPAVAREVERFRIHGDSRSQSCANALASRYVVAEVEDKMGWLEGAQPLPAGHARVGQSPRDDTEVPRGCRRAARVPAVDDDRALPRRRPAGGAVGVPIAGLISEFLVGLFLRLLPPLHPALALFLHALPLTQRRRRGSWFPELALCARVDRPATA